jgi:AcrR family transcriptional regulator
MTKHKNSSRERWIKEAKKEVIKNGVEAINIDNMSKKLGVAKTSFYHFFNSKSEFLELLFDSGIKEGTDNVIDLIYATEPENRIDKLIEIVFFKNLNFELFLRRLRTYGLQTKTVARLIQDIENRREEFFKNLLVESGIEETQASEKAHFFYTYSLGLYERIYVDPDILKDKQKLYDRLHRIIDCID